MTADLISRARSGDHDAFGELTAPHRRELQVHCYRMLGSLQDAEDALQEALLAAWQGLGTFEERASLRTWLYKIATNRCLDVRRAAGKRPAKAWDVPGFEPPEPTHLGEISWLEPFPDGPEGRLEQHESMSLAFIKALQSLPPRQLAVLVLRDVLEFRASQVAEMLGATVESVNSALKRARATMQRQDQTPRHHDRQRYSAPEGELVANFVRAYEAADVDAIVGLLTDDAFMSMPPIALEYEGAAALAAFLTRFFGMGRRYDLLPTRANGQPAFGLYLRTDDGPHPGVGLIVLTVAGDRISGITRFEHRVLPWFELPSEL